MAIAGDAAPGVGARGTAAPSVGARSGEADPLRRADADVAGSAVATRGMRSVASGRRSDGPRAAPSPVVVGGWLTDSAGRDDDGGGTTAVALDTGAVVIPGTDPGTADAGGATWFVETGAGGED